jgi:hypothetical protein
MALIIVPTSSSLLRDDATSRARFALRRRNKRGEAHYLSRVMEEVHDRILKCTNALQCCNANINKEGGAPEGYDHPCAPAFAKINNPLRCKVEKEGGAQKWATTTLQQSPARTRKKEEQT